MSVRIASWPHWYEPNRYLPLFYDALAPYGITHVPNLPLSTQALLDPASRVSVLHIHWPYPIWRDRDRWLPRQVLSIARLWRLLRQLGRSGVRVIWTVHNVRSQEGGNLSDYIGHRLLYRIADLCVFHSESAREAAQARYGPRTKATVVMPHGNYDGALPSPVPRRQTLDALGIPPGRKILLCFGQVRRYKGFDLAVKALDHLPRDEFHLIIAGRPLQPGAEMLGQACSPPENVSLLLQDLDDQLLADLLEAADAVLLPYRDITSSGALLHALTLSKGVIATDLPYFREILSNAPSAGVLVPMENPAALADGIAEFFQADPAERGRAARSIASAYAWSRVVVPVANWIISNVDRGIADRGSRWGLGSGNAVSG